MFLKTTTVKHTNTPFFSISSGAKLSIWQLGTLWKIKLMENSRKIKFLGGGDIVKCCCLGRGADQGPRSTTQPHCSAIQGRMRRVPRDRILGYPCPRVMGASQGGAGRVSAVRGVTVLEPANPTQQ